MEETISLDLEALPRYSHLLKLTPPQMFIFISFENFHGNTFNNKVEIILAPVESFSSRILDYFNKEPKNYCHTRLLSSLILLLIYLINKLQFCHILASFCPSTKITDVTQTRTLIFKKEYLYNQSINNIFLSLIITLSIPI